MKLINENDIPEVKELLREILKWIRFQGWQDVKQVLIETLGSEREKLMYQMSDGRSTNEISKAVGVSSMTVYNYWQRWSKIGIAEPFEGYKGRYRRSFSLDDFGIDFPSIPSQRQPSSKNEENDKQGGDLE
ncbi:MAG: helix-turn-helix domain-containing protein [Candidatus Methanofastidiosia archaeon]